MTWAVPCSPAPLITSSISLFPVTPLAAHIIPLDPQPRSSSVDAGYSMLALGSLPVELQLNILGFVSPTDVASLFETSRHFKQIIARHSPAICRAILEGPGPRCGLDLVRAAIPRPYECGAWDSQDVPCPTWLQPLFEDIDDASAAAKALGIADPTMQDQSKMDVDTGPSVANDPHAQATHRTCCDMTCALLMGAVCRTHPSDFQNCLEIRYGEVDDVNLLAWSLEWVRRAELLIQRWNSAVHTGHWLSATPVGSGGMASEASPL
ncbi:hypothetical protein MRB53_038692 [Persea americana]|nr:hypothetical protein MRB53_038692 [Persea americana]